MEKKLLIGTLNCQNNKYNRNFSFYKEDSAKILVKHIENMEYDFFGTQEITKPFLTRIKNYTKKYISYGNYRYKNKSIFNHILGIKHFNENNNIFLKDKVKSWHTIYLPWLPRSLSDIFKSCKKGFFIPRIVTVVITKDNFCIINTHLEYRISSIQEKQLECIQKIVRDNIESYKVILMGDFNASLSSDLFQKFIRNISDLGLRRVEVNVSTQQSKKAAIDHIFIPSNWSIEESGLMTNLDAKIEQITDHKGVYVKVKVK